MGENNHEDDTLMHESYYTLYYDYLNRGNNALILPEVHDRIKIIQEGYLETKNMTRKVCNSIELVNKECIRDCEKNLVIYFIYSSISYEYEGSNELLNFEKFRNKLRDNIEEFRNGLKSSIPDGIYDDLERRLDEYEGFYNIKRVKK